MARITNRRTLVAIALGSCAGSCANLGLLTDNSTDASQHVDAGADVESDTNGGEGDRDAASDATVIDAGAIDSAVADVSAFDAAKSDAGAPLAITFVQSAAAFMHTTNSIDVPLAKPVFAHDALVAAVYCNNAGTAPAMVPVFDTYGNTFTVVQTLVDTQANSPNGESFFIAVALDVAAGIGDTVTTTTTGNATYTQMFVAEFANVATMNAFDVGTSATGTSVSANTAMASGNRTTTAAGDLLFGFAVSDNYAAPGVGFVNDVTGDAGAGNLIEHMIAPTAGAYQVTAAEYNGLGDWAILMAALKAQTE